MLAAVLEARLRRHFPGFLFLGWLALASAGRLFLEAFRGDSVIVFGTVRLPQLMSLVLLLTAPSCANPRRRSGPRMPAAIRYQ